MPFIGKTPETGAFRLIDSITTSATDTYALTVQGDHYFPESARNLIVSLNGVTQAPETAYTVSGSHIVFASALTSSDVIDYILVIGDAVDIGTPSDGTVGDAQLKASLDLSGKTLTLANDQISGDVIHGGTISNFASTGIDDNATSTAITIDSSENVSITPSGGVITLGANGHITSKQSLDVATSGGRYMGASTRGLVGQIRIEQTTTSANGGYVAFDTCASGSTSPTERMRIDSSGNLLVGKDALGTANEGMQVKPAGELVVTRANNHTFILNRKSSDGDIALLQKDGTTVGNIGTKSNGMYIGTEDSGIFFNHHGGGNLDAIFPYDVSTNTFYNGQMNVGGPTNQFGAGYFNYTTIDNGAVYNNFSGASGVAFSGTGTSPCNNAGATTDGVHDLGRSTQRWKDIYLSGDVVQGNTSGGFITFNTGLNGVSQGNTQQTNLFDRATTATAATGTVYVSVENSGQNVMWGYIIDFFYSNNTLTTTARETGNSQGTTTCTVQANGTAISVSVAYAGGLGGNIRFNAGGHASVCNY